MFKKIKYILKMKGYLKLGTTVDKAQYLLFNYKNIDIYKSSISTSIASLESDISTYDKILTTIRSQDITTTNLVINNVSEFNIITKDIKYWYTIDGYIITDKTILKSFLSNCLFIVQWYEENDKNYDPTIMYNIRRLRPYYLNIGNILDVLLSLPNSLH